MNNEIYHMIKNLQKVSGFLGSADKPTPISDNEIKRILGQVSESAVTQKAGMSFEIGENEEIELNKRNEMEKCRSKEISLMMKMPH